MSWHVVAQWKPKAEIAAIQAEQAQMAQMAQEQLAQARAAHAQQTQQAQHAQHAQHAQAQMAAPQATVEATGEAGPCESLCVSSQWSMFAPVRLREIERHGRCAKSIFDWISTIFQLQFLDPFSSLLQAKGNILFIFL